jgi:Cys-tRNA(Pro)/Cys-tRNA(Cys) deacylase
MTPAILIVKKARIHYKIHEYDHGANRTDNGTEAVLKLNIDPNRVIKTLIAKLKPSEFVVAMIPVTEQLSMKKLARAAGAKHASMAPLDRIKALTGYYARGISPLVKSKN